MIQCPHCKGTTTSKAGLRKNKSGFIQKHYCLKCKVYFVRRNGFERMRCRPEIIVDALDLRAKGMSLGKIQNHIEQRYGIKVSRVAILYWQKKFGEMIEHLTESFQLSFSYNSHADEMFLREKGQRGDQFIYYWDVVDYDTKFLVADHLSYERNDQQAILFLRKLKQKIKVNPIRIHTDNSYDYLSAIKRVFGWRGVTHVHFPAWRRKFKNNPIERVHNTIRECYKVMRRFASIEGAISYFRLWKNYYNFIRPHITLCGRTPAEAAGFGRYNWYSIIKLFLIHILSTD